MPSDDKRVAERLLVHARLCHQMASQTGNEEIAAELRKLAQDCVRAAREAGPAVTIH
jgi:hypothetical protein